MLRPEKALDSYFENVNIRMLSERGSFVAGRHTYKCFQIPHPHESPCPW